ncbi:MAG: hypothetical protein ACRD09_10510 [Vicinamibacterales bacterium]
MAKLIRKKPAARPTRTPIETLDAVLAEARRLRLLLTQSAHDSPLPKKASRKKR